MGHDASRIGDETQMTFTTTANRQTEPRGAKSGSPTATPNPTTLHPSIIRSISLKGHENATQPGDAAQRPQQPPLANVDLLIKKARRNPRAAFYRHPAAAVAPAASSASRRVR